MTILFASDLHLDPARPAATRCFLRFLAGPARDADALYILGDLFEAWTGDDAAGDHERQIITALNQYTTTGNRLCFLPGNRDFLVGPRFATETGASLLDDEALIDIGGQRVLLMHGDTLCTDDHDYQRYRRFARSAPARSVYLALPVPLRNAIAGYARRRSTEASAGKPPTIMDVNVEAVDAALRRHDARWLVHGHTHRPAIHRTELDGEPVLRIVLGAWYEQGSLLTWDTSGPELRTLKFD